MFAEPFSAFLLRRLLRRCRADDRAFLGKARKIYKLDIRRNGGGRDCLSANNSSSFLPSTAAPYFPPYVAATESKSFVTEKSNDEDEISANARRKLQGDPSAVWDYILVTSSSLFHVAFLLQGQKSGGNGVARGQHKRIHKSKSPYEMRNSHGLTR